MTLDEAIQNAKESERQYRKNALDAARIYAFDKAREHLKGAQEMHVFLKWLEELKQCRQNQSHWIDMDGLYICAHCGAEAGVMTRFCSDCGFRMDGGCTE